MKICDIFFKKGRTLFVERQQLMESGMSFEEANKCLYACCPTMASYIYAKRMGIPEENIFKHISDNKEFAEWLKTIDMKFDYIIQNPPYNKSLHLDFLESGIDRLAEGGTMVIIEPATWLINVRRNGKAKRYDAIKEKLNGYIKSVVIENLNKEFGTAQDVPFATTTIDMSKTYDSIDCMICGEHKVINSIYDCNFIGKYETIWSILDKVNAYGDMMENHIYTKKTKVDNDIKYMRYWNYQLYALGSNYGGVVNQFNNNSDAVLKHTDFGVFFQPYVDSLCCGEVCNNVPLSIKKGNPCDCVYGTNIELNNWAYNTKHNKLFTFLTIATIFDKHNEAKDVIPWLVDKQYTDEEINEKFGFTEEEVKLIDSTLKKYERNSPWFKRYMCGKDAVSDEEVNNFIKKISK